MKTKYKIVITIVHTTAITAAQIVSFLAASEFSRASEWFPALKQESTLFAFTIAIIPRTVEIIEQEQHNVDMIVTIMDSVK
jgi:hypothetical protein